LCYNGWKTIRRGLLGSVFALSGANIVILARNYNPSIISKEWLYKRNILRETVTNFVHTPPLSVVEAERISFVLDENRLQISLKTISPEGIEVLPKIATEFVSCLPETPFVAAGFNYSYYLPKESRRLETLFSPNDAKLKELFAEDYEIGGMVCFHFKEFIVTMSAPPLKGETTKVAINFNFHSESRGANEVKERLKLHPQTIERAEGILRGLSK